MTMGGVSTNNQPIVMAGLVSGIDTKSIIQQLLNAQKGPLTIMQAKVAVRQQEQGAIKDIASRLSNLLTAIQNFDDPSYLQTKTAGVTAGGASATVAVTAAPGATVGSFQVTVDQLADATRVSSPNAIGAAITSGALLKDANFGIGVTAGSFTVNGVAITIDPAVDTLDAVMQRIRDTVPGVNVALVADSSGRMNALQISGGADVTLGSGGDTSNFLSATKLLSSPGSATRTSTGNLGVTQTGALLSGAQLVTPLGAPTGTFKVNGVEISYDSSRDSLSTVLSRINNSTAGVTATYDPVNDRVSFVNKTTGSTSIQLQDETGNFLAAIGVAGAAQTLGKNAKYEIDTGAGPVTRYSTTNTIADALPGVTLTLLKQGMSADTVTISQDIDGAVSHMRDLVSQVNSTLSFIDDKTKFDPNVAKATADSSTPVTNGTLAGDYTINQINDAIKQLLTSPIDGVTDGKKTLADLGLSFGNVGSKPGTTTTLVLDEAKFRAALQADPAGVSNVLAAFRSTATLNGGGTGALQGLSGAPSALRKPGTYSITTTLNDDGTAKITATFTPTDGGTGTTATVNSAVAGATLTNLIPGVAVTLKGALTAGTDTVTIGTPTRGIAAKLEQYLDPLTRTGGILAQRQDAATADITDMNNQIQRLNDNLNQQQQMLQDKFGRMEVALSKLQEQRSALASLAQAAGG